MVTLAELRFDGETLNLDSWSPGLLHTKSKVASSLSYSLKKQSLTLLENVVSAPQPFVAVTNHHGGN